jgi:hypothetical protein
MRPHAVVVAEGVRDSESFVGDGMNGIICARHRQERPPGVGRIKLQLLQFHHSNHKVCLEP